MVGLRITQWLTALVASVAASIAAVPAAAVQAAPIGTFESPVFVAVAPGAPRLLFVVEQPGRIQVLRNEVTQPQPFLDITDIVRAPPGGEDGLLSVAFPADYPRSRLFYVFFVNLQGNLEVNEFRRSANPLRANRSSRRVVLRIPHPIAANHNGGQLQFGPGGLLFISTGDGGGVLPRGEAARKLDNLLGKILRIDPRRTRGLPYRIPRVNPFVGKPGRDEIFAYGLRNPWRFSFDGWRIAIGDVGQENREEVNFLPIHGARGVNFGWPQYEGDVVFDSTRPGPHPPVFPMFTYDHSGGRCAVIGGYVVRGRDLPSLSGRYLYGDACTGEIRSFIPKVATQTASDDKPTGLALPGLSSFGRGYGGQIYVAQTSGAVSRLEPDAPHREPVARN